MYSGQNIKRIRSVLIIFIFLFCVLTLRTGYITSIWGKELSVITDSQYKANENAGNINYSLLDSNGKELLEYTPKYYFVVEPDTFIKNNSTSDMRAYKTVVYTLRNYNKDYDLSQIGFKDKKMKLYYSVDESTYNKLKDIKGVKGVYAYIKPEVDRTYPWKYENLISSYNTIDNQPKSKDSIEGLIHEKTSTNEFPKISFDKDLLGEYSAGNYIVPKNTVNVRLTTDKELESNIKDILLKDKYKKYGQIGVVLMEASTGKIKAMVQRDDWKPNINLCSATENGYEPGSIFKTIMAEAALESNPSLINKKFQCDEEKESHGNLNMEEAYEVSCNAYFQKLSQSLKFDNVIKLATSQGLFSKVLNFYGNEEVKGDFITATSSNGVMRNIAIGQSMRITPVQALGIVNTVINGGKYVKPYLLDAFVDSNNSVIEQLKTEDKQIIKNSTASRLKSMMLNVVRSSKGTGRQAYIQDIEIGGKTGTNERLETPASNGTTEGTQNVEKRSDGWFIGYYKINNKYYSMIVFVNDIDVELEAAGSTAAPIFKEIVEKVSGK